MFLLPSGIKFKLNISHMRNFIERKNSHTVIICRVVLKGGGGGGGETWSGVKTLNVRNIKRERVFVDLDCVKQVMHRERERDSQRRARWSIRMYKYIACVYPYSKRVYVYAGIYIYIHTSICVYTVSLFKIKQCVLLMCLPSHGQWRLCSVCAARGSFSLENSVFGRV